jgi:hypothetical protein
MRRITCLYLPNSERALWGISRNYIPNQTNCSVRLKGAVRVAKAAAGVTSKRELAAWFLKALRIMF